MDTASIYKAMKEPELLRPKQVFEFYAYLSAIYAEMHVKASEKKAGVARQLATLVHEGKSVAAAKVIADGSPDGQEYIRLQGGLVGLEEAIRSLKKMQGYFDNESRNQY